MDIEAGTASSIRKHYLFSSLGDDQWRNFISKVDTTHLSAQELLFRRGDDAKCFYMVAEGQINLFLLSRDGHQKIVEVVMPGNTFAEAVMFMDMQQYPVNAQALTRSTVYRFPNQEFVAILKQNTDTCLRLLGDVCRRLHARLVEVEDLTVQNATHRLIRYLLMQLGEAGTDGNKFELGLSRQVIASRLSMQPETLSRLMRNLVKEGIIEVDGRNVHVPDVQRLKSFE